MDLPQKPPRCQLQCMVLRDIKNELCLNAELHAPASTLKQIMDSECNTSVPNKRIVIGSPQLDAFYSSAVLNTVNACPDITNGVGDCFVPILNEHGTRKTKIPIEKHKVSKERNLELTVASREAPISTSLMQLSPDFHSMSEQCFFTGLSINSKNEGHESSEPSLNCINKYFSTPMPSNAKPRKKLSPIIEVEREARVAIVLQELQSKDKLACRIGDPLYDSPQYRSFFANECQEIVKQIEGSKNDSSPGKRKAEELEVSSLDAEPLPYDYTPMKSMLAYEVSHMIASPENSPVRDGASLFGESLLDLEKTDMQFPDFDLSACGDKRKRHFSNDSSVKKSNVAILDGVCCTKWQNIVSLSSDRDKGFHLKPVHSFAAKQGVHSTSHKHLQSLMTDGANVLNVSQVLEANAKNKQTPIAIKYLNKCANTMHDYDEILPANNTLALPVNTTLDIDFLTDPTNQVEIINATELVELLPQTLGNTTQGIVKVNKICIANTTKVMDVEQTSTNIQNRVSFNEDTRSTNTTWVMDEVPETCFTIQKIGPENGTITANAMVMGVMSQSANTTQDISLTHKGAITANTTRDMGVVSKSADITQDIVFASKEGKAANTTQVIGVVPPSADTTQNIVLTHEEGKTVNATQDISLTHKEVTTANTTQDMGVVQQSADITQDIGLTHEEKTANATQVIGVVPQSADTIQDIVLTHAEGNAANTTQVMGETAQSVCTISPNEVNEANTTQVMEVIQVNACEMALIHKAKDKANEVRACDAYNKAPSVDHFTLHVLSAQANTDVTRKDISGRNEGDHINTSAAISSSHYEVLPSKVPRGHFLLSESCSMIQVEENVHDVSVFSVGSLSFITSTPVAGLTNFHFPKACKDSENHESVVEPQRNIFLDKPMPKRPVQEESSVANEDSQKHSKVGSMLPTTTKRTVLPPKMSSIPSARRSLVLFQNPLVQVSAKETMPSTISSNCISLKGTIRPAMTQQRFSKVSVGKLKQTDSAIPAGPSTNKPVSRLRTPKTTAEKAKTTSTSSQLSPTPTVKTLNSLRHISIGIHNGTNSLQEPSCEEMSGVRPSVGFRTGILKPGCLSLRPPLPSNAQKASSKSNALKSNLPGLPIKKREMSTLVSLKDMGSVKGEGMAARKMLKQSKPTQVFPNKASSKATEKPNCSRSQAEHAAEGSLEKCLPMGKIPKTTESVGCNHLEICKCCDSRYQQLLKENVDLKRQLGLGQDEHGKTAVSETTDHTVN